MMQAALKSSCTCIFAIHPCTIIFPWRLKIGLKATTRPNPSSCQGGRDSPWKLLRDILAPLDPWYHLYGSGHHVRTILYATYTPALRLSILGSLTRYRPWLASAPLSNMLNGVGAKRGPGAQRSPVLDSTNVAHLRLFLNTPNLRSKCLLNWLDHAQQP